MAERDQNIAAAVSAREKALIEKASQRRGMSRSAFIRSAALLMVALVEDPERIEVLRAAIRRRAEKEPERAKEAM